MGNTFGKQHEPARIRWNGYTGHCFYSPSSEYPVPPWRDCGELHLLVYVALFFLLVLLFFPSNSFAEGPGIAYTVAIEGIEDKTLRSSLEGVSHTFALKARPPASVGLLRRRMEKDTPKLIKLLRSKGYFSARVNAVLDREKDPVHITFQVDLGPPFLLKSIRIDITGTQRGLREKLSSAEDLGLIPGNPCDMQTIINAKKRLLRDLRGVGFPFPELKEQQVVVDHRDESITVNFVLYTGPAGRFGDTTFVGLESVDESFLQGMLPWKKGDPYNGSLLDKAHNRLINTRLFSVARLSPAKSLDDEGLLDIDIRVKERKHRSVNAGISYKTDEGLGGELDWEHRNFFGKGEKLLLQAFASQIRYGSEGTYSKPSFLRPDQSLLFKLRMAEDSPDGYTSRSAKSSLLIERVLTTGMRVGAGPTLKFSRVEQLAVKENFSLVSLVSFFNYDTSDDLLNPSRGGRLSLEVVPFYEALEEGHFLKAYANYRRYYPIVSTQSLVAAASGTIGILTGAARDRIPADERFYAGGGGSIRGYAYQSVGPLVNGEPVGGRSLLELSLELRFRISEAIGAVAFLDGGNTFEPEHPDFSEGLLWGAGMGFRYFTSFGPFRMDAGIPLDRRDGIDGAIQVYISIGQAF